MYLINCYDHHAYCVMHIGADDACKDDDAIDQRLR